MGSRIGLALLQILEDKGWLELRTFREMPLLVRRGLIIEGKVSLLKDMKLIKQGVNLTEYEPC